jgi:hypothetical protein
VGEDQDPAGARGLDEAERGDRLAGPGGVLEPEAPALAGVLGVRLGGGLLLGLLGRVPVERLLVHQLVTLDLDLDGGQLLGGSRPSVRGGGVPGLQLGGERGQRARQGVDLVRAQLGAVGEVRLFLGEKPLEPQQERVVAPPLDRRLLAAGLDLLQRGVEGVAASGALGQRLAGVLSGQHEGLAREFFGAREEVAGNRRIGEGRACVSHVRAL